MSTLLTITQCLKRPLCLWSHNASNVHCVNDHRMHQTSTVLMITQCVNVHCVIDYRMCQRSAVTSEYTNSSSLWCFRWRNIVELSSHYYTWMCKISSHCVLRNISRVTSYIFERWFLTTCMACVQYQFFHTNAAHCYQNNFTFSLTKPMLFQ